MNFESQLNNLLDRTQNIKSPINVGPSGAYINEYNEPSNIWMDDVQIFYSKYLKKHALGDRIKSLLFHRKYNEIVSALKSISNDESFIAEMNDSPRVLPVNHQATMASKYDVFISHANKDKADFVEELYQSLDKLGIQIFYDRKTFEWGDKWKEQILDGVGKAEFAIIVISENFFDRVWTEEELNQFLNRQNKDGQKLILPILKNITIKQLEEKYPSVTDIQAIDSSEYTTDEIALLFARQLIKRLKAQ